MSVTGSFVPPENSKGVIWEKEKNSGDNPEVRVTIFVPSTHTFYDALVDTTGNENLKYMEVLDWISWMTVEWPRYPPGILRNVKPLRTDHRPFEVKRRENDLEIHAHIVVPDREHIVGELGLDMAWSTEVGPVLLLGFNDEGGDERLRRGVFSRGFIKRDVRATMDRITEFVVHANELKYPEISPNDRESGKLEEMIRQVENFVHKRKTLPPPPVTYDEAKVRQETIVEREKMKTPDDDDVIDHSVPCAPAPKLPEPQHWMKKEDKKKLDLMREFLNSNRIHVAIVYTMQNSRPGAGQPYIALAFCKMIGTVYMTTLAHKSTTDRYQVGDWLECRVDYNNKAKVCYIEQILGVKESLVQCKQLTIGRTPALHMKICLDLSKWKGMKDDQSSDHGMVIHDHAHKVYVPRMKYKAHGNVKVVAIVEHNERTREDNPMSLAVTLLEVVTDVPREVEQFIKESNECYNPLMKKNSNEFEVSNDYEVAGPPPDDDDDDDYYEPDDEEENEKLPCHVHPGDKEYMNGPFGKPFIHPINPHLNNPVHMTSEPPRNAFRPEPERGDYTRDTGYGSRREEEYGSTNGEGSRYEDRSYNERSGRGDGHGRGSEYRGESSNISYVNFNEQSERESGRYSRHSDDNMSDNSRWRVKNEEEYREPLPADDLSATGFVALVTKKYAFVYCDDHKIAYIDMANIERLNMHVGRTYDFRMKRTKPVSGAQYEVIVVPKPVEVRDFLTLDVVDTAELRSQKSAFQCTIRVRDDVVHITEVECDQLGIFDMSNVEKITLLRGNYPSGLPDRHESIKKSQLMYNVVYSCWMIPELTGRGFTWTLFGIDDRAQGYRVRKDEDDEIDKIKREPMHGNEIRSNDGPMFSGPSRRGPSSLASSVISRAPTAASSALASSSTLRSAPSADPTVGTSEEVKLLNHIWSYPNLRQAIKETNFVLYDFVDEWAQKQQHERSVRGDGRN